MSDYRDIMVLHAVYDASDMMSDYWHPNMPLFSFYVGEMPGKRRTISKLRKALKRLPDWIQRLDWNDDKTYYDLRFLKSDRVGDRVIKTSGGGSGLTFTLEYEMVYGDNAYVNGHDRNMGFNMIPSSLSAFNKMVDNIIAERQRVRDEAKAAAKVRRRIPQGASHVLDQYGFRPITQEERETDTPRDELEHKWFKDTDWSKVIIDL